MRATILVFALSSAAIAQDVSRVFQLHHMESAQELEFTVLVRSIAEVTVNPDVAKSTLSVHGNAAQIAIAEFLFTELDRQTVPDSVTQEFRVPNNADDVVRLFFVRNAATIPQFHEVATTIRTIADIRVFTYSNSRALAVRGSADQIAATDFLIRELDQPADAKRTDSHLYRMTDTVKFDDGAIRVFYLPYTATIQQFQEVATMVRTIAEIRRVFTYNAPRAMIVRGTSAQLALADWMIHELAKPSTAAASQKYTYDYADRDGENLVRIFYVKDAPTTAAFQQIATQIRATAKIRRVFTYNESKAIAVRGTDAQLATAEQMLQDRQVALK